MKKYIRTKKLILIFSILTIMLLTLAGCQSKSNSTVQASNGKTFSRKGFNPQQMKQKMEDGLKALVADGTITQSQSDKILAALSTNSYSGRGQRTNNSNNNNQSSGTNNNSQSNNNSQANNGQNRQRFNPLSKLVSDGVITQTQADAVMQKLRGNSSSSSSNK